MAPSWADFPASPTYSELARTQYRLQGSIHFSRLVRGNPWQREVALTFDDGPHTIFTPRLLQILREQQVPATFFVVGTRVDEHPELVRQEVAEGHEVANHTYHHARLCGLSPQTVEDELRGGASAIERAVGTPSRLFRPPGGEYDAEVIRIADRLGYVMVLWTADPADFERPAPALIEQRVLRDVSRGGIILLHDGVPETLEMLPALIRHLRGRGYRFVNCSQLALRGGVVTWGGPCVYPPRRTRGGRRPPFRGSFSHPGPLSGAPNVI